MNVTIYSVMPLILIIHGFKIIIFLQQSASSILLNNEKESNAREKIIIIAKTTIKVYTYPQ